MPDATRLLELVNVSKRFRAGGREVQAVRNVSLFVRPRETVALVGESGSGKSTLGQIALCLLAPDTGEVRFRGSVLSALTGARLRRTRIAMQPIFQDPGASFNPRRRVQSLLGQALIGHPKAERLQRAANLLDRVGLRPARSMLGRLPHELSGGQRQRLAVARALAMDPELIIADEPLSGADVSIRGQILNLLLELQEERGMAYLMITHDIAMAGSFAHRVAVMTQGEIVEVGDAEAVLAAPAVAYTQRLVAAARKQNLASLLHQGLRQ